ncbi:Gfo/Idh/MocA family protein [Poriferisphaera sp. WC338]|uniref:Gfo/Idh/MocA family protein n=1 Tax=Poriferisphaera sp. WC338 TaxID=3425129 RepID=UPI003D81593D
MCARKAKALRAAFIGAGGIAKPHLDALARIDEVEVVALADVNTKVMEEHAEAYAIDSSGLYTDYKKMLAKVKPEVVFVCTPNGLHAPASIAASKAGAHVMVEKPMAMNAREAKRMIDAAKKARKKIICGLQFRFDPKTQFLKKQVDAGQLGNIMFGRVQAMRRRGIPNWGVFGQKELQGGGPMIDIGVHALEMCHYVMGSPKPIAASGMTWTYLGDKPSDQIECLWPNWDHKNYDVEDLAVGHIRFDNGAVIHIESSFIAHIEPTSIMDFQLMGTKGGCKWDSSTVSTDQHGYMIDYKPTYNTPGDFNENFYRKNRNFIDHLLYGAKPIAPTEDGLMVQQMLDAIYQSADKGGKEVRISP